IRLALINHHVAVRGVAEHRAVDVLVRIAWRRQGVAGAFADPVILRIRQDRSAPIAAEAVVAGLARRPVPPDRPGAVIILLVEIQRQAYLPAVAQARRLARPLSRLRENWEEDRCQDGDDRDHDEQLDQGEAELLESL